MPNATTILPSTFFPIGFGAFFRCIAGVSRNLQFDFPIDGQYTPYGFSMQWPVGLSEFGASGADRRGHFCRS
jgi:hypothetical protein